MSATNHTPNYTLPQFIATDVPTWLVDVNGAFSDIDTAIHNAQEAAGTASTLATTAKNKADAVETSLGTTNGNVTTLQTTVGVQQTSIDANTNKIGSAPLATVSQNLSGAVNELVARIPSTTSACDELEGTANHQVRMFQMIEPASAAISTCSSTICAELTISAPMVLATPVLYMAPIKFSPAAIIMA